MKPSLIILLLLFPLLTLAQQLERVEVLGNITAPAGEDVEEISVYNISSEKGTVSNAKGEFKLKVAEHDRIRITALQFQSFTIIITAEDISSRELLVYLNPNVNQLEEVTVRSTDLSGIAELDVKRIKTSVYNPDLDLSYVALEFGYNFENDGQIGVTGNAAEDALGNNSFSIANLDFIKLMELFFPRKNRSVSEVNDSNRFMPKVLLDRYGKDYIAEKFDIPYEKINEFVYFTEENGLIASLLSAENEILLLEFLLVQSEVYKKLLATGD